MDRIDLLRIFLRVAETGSFSAAAEQLAVPRATVSWAVQRLESLLKAKLLHRTTRRVSLSQEGEALFDQARALVADMEDLELRFQPADEAIAGRLRVELPSRIARRLVAPALPDFLQRFPRIEIELGSSDRTVDLIQEGVDCALRVGDLASDSVVARPLGKFDVINCASPAYLARQGTPGAWQDLASHVAVNYVSRTSGRVAPWTWDNGGTLQTMRMTGRATADNAETYIECALAGLGLIQIPRYDVVHHLSAGELVEVMPDFRAAPMPVHLVYPHRRRASRRVQVFLEWIDTLVRPLADASARE